MLFRMPMVCLAATATAHSMRPSQTCAQGSSGKCQLSTDSVLLQQPVWGAGAGDPNMRLARLEEQVTRLEFNVGNFRKEGNTIELEDVNLRVHTGHADNDGVAGTGNLVVGNEHVIAEARNGFVAGFANEIAGEGTSVTAGSRNIASGAFAAVLGGHQNIADGEYSAVAGGHTNDAHGAFSLVGGGGSNHADGDESVVFGGEENVAADPKSTAGAGRFQIAEGELATAMGTDAIEDIELPLD